MDTFGPQYLLFLCPPLEQGVIQIPYVVEMNTSKMLPHSTDEYQMKSSEEIKNSLFKIEFKESMAHSEFY